jgi:integrase
VYERAGYGIWIDYTDENGKRVRQPLGHDDQDQAKAKADEVALQFRREAKRQPQQLTLRTLFDTYAKEVSPGKSATAQAHDGRALEMFGRAFGTDRQPATLSRRDWDTFIDRRRRGDIAPEGGRIGRAVRDRAVEQDCNLLLAVLNWATQSKDASGKYLLDRNPLKGLPVPSEASPARPVLSATQFATLCEVAREREPWLECFAIVCWFTGHRTQSVRLLRWSDIDFEAGTAHWRGANDKIGYDHVNPVDAIALAALKQHRARSGVVNGEAWVFPSPRDAKLPRSSNAMCNAWKRIAPAAGIPTGKRFGWHSCRRAFANDLRDVALRDLKDLGGWKSERTVVSVYQQTSEAAQRRALQRRSPTPSGSPSGPVLVDSEAQSAQPTGTGERIA